MVNTAAWVEAQYRQGRTTAIASEEMLELVHAYLPENVNRLQEAPIGTHPRLKQAPSTPRFAKVTRTRLGRLAGPARPIPHSIDPKSSSLKKCSDQHTAV